MKIVFILANGVSPNAASHSGSVSMYAAFLSWKSWYTNIEFTSNILTVKGKWYNPLLHRLFLDHDIISIFRQHWKNSRKN